jgi:hypothetical protein
MGEQDRLDPTMNELNLLQRGSKMAMQMGMLGHHVNAPRSPNEHRRQSLLAMAQIRVANHFLGKVGRCVAVFTRGFLQSCSMRCQA